MNFQNYVPGGNKFISHYKNGNNADIIKTFFARYKEAMEQGKKLAPLFQKGSFLESCNLVYNFVKYKIKYQVDPDGTQLIQLPSHLLNVSKSGDCKSKTLLCAAIISNFNFDGKRPLITIDFVNYDNIKSYTHVYLRATLENETFIIDTVFFAFNKEKKYFSRKSYDMQINSVSGFGEASTEEISGKKGKAKRAAKKETRKSKKASKKKDRKEKRAAKKASGKGGGRGLFKAAKKVSLAVPRGAFLSLVLVNARGLATKLLNAPGDKALKIWDALGGNRNKLMEAINKGGAKKPFLGSKISGVDGVEGLENMEGIGVVGAATVTTLLVSAAAVLAAFAPILKMVDKNKGTKDGESTDALLYEAESAGGDVSIPDGEVGDPDPGSEKSKSGSGSDSGSGFGFSLDSIDMKSPVVWGLGLGAAYLGAKALKIIK